jgi:Phage terminase, small subunit
VAGQPRRRARLAEAGELVPVEPERHGSGCACRRCAGFEPGNEAAVRHGSYVSPARLASDPRTRAIADEVRASMPAYSPADEVTIELLAVTLRRVERATAAIEANDDMAGDSPLSPYLIPDAGAVRALRDDLRSWVNTAAKLAASLGLTPLSRAKLGLDVALTRRALTVTELHAAAAAEDGEGAA